MRTQLRTHTRERRLDEEYDDVDSMGYRDLCLNVEVGWVIRNGVVQMEAVKNWLYLDCKTLVCEIQGTYACVFKKKERPVTVCVCICVCVSCVL
jgi:hypothetical protein